jgi:hypothetical protein
MDSFCVYLWTRARATSILVQHVTSHWISPRMPANWTCHRVRVQSGLPKVHRRGDGDLPDFFFFPPPGALVDFGVGGYIARGLVAMGQFQGFGLIQQILITGIGENWGFSEINTMQFADAPAITRWVLAGLLQGSCNWKLTGPVHVCCQEILSHDSKNTEAAVGLLTLWLVPPGTKRGSG